MRRMVVPQNVKRRILNESLREDKQRDAAFRRMIRSVPKGRFRLTAKSLWQQATPYIIGRSHDYCAAMLLEDCRGSAL